ncbi:unnamed protein product [Arctia plantaginis]|uniref:C-type lectin domain-containing protein n=1 Tax=Arctia plantaginis TaxID=874455 RepID=A0A8S1B8I6_ARCPL|nr:unnamed protein product [Arctia plantaginis]
MKSVVKVVFFGAFLTYISAKQIQFFRKDYTYNETFDAFYKLHWNYKVFTWDDAFLACDDEGASLFYPKNTEELHLIRKLAMEVARSHNDSVTDIFLGLHDKYGLGEFVTVDGLPTESSLSVSEPTGNIRFISGYCVLMNILKGSYRVGPCARKDLQDGLNFVCKKTNSVMCPTVDLEYKHAKSLRKCYKINRRQKTWDEAYRTCYMEGGILTIMQNENEARWLQDFLQRNAHNEDRFHVGTHSVTPGGEIYTIKGQKLDTVYQYPYGDNDREFDCGAIIKSSGSQIYTTTTDCNKFLPFICEIEITNI